MVYSCAVCWLFLLGKKKTTVVFLSMCFSHVATMWLNTTMYTECLLRDTCRNKAVCLAPPAQLITGELYNRWHSVDLNKKPGGVIKTLNKYDEQATANKGTKICTCCCLSAKNKDSFLVNGAGNVKEWLKGKERKSLGWAKQHVCSQNE